MIIPPPHTPAISIIIPVYNVEDYLVECLESVCQQTIEEIEIICVNDGSTDNSASILEMYTKKDPRIHIIHTTHKGSSSARNQGLAHANAEYIQFIDADDYIEPTASSVMYNTMRQHDVDIVMCGLTTHYEEGQEYRDKEQIELYYTKEKQGIYPINLENISYTLVSVCVKMIKKSLLNAYNIRFVERRVYEDNYFTLAYLSVANNIYFLPDKLYHRRFRNHSVTDRISRGHGDERIDLFYQLEHLFYFLVRNNRWTTGYAIYFWNYYIIALCETVANYTQVSHSMLYTVIDRFVRKNKCSIPHIPELTGIINFLSQFLGYEI